MDRPLTIVGAPTSIGIKPYEDGSPRGLDQAPATLRRLGLAARLGADDAGDVVPLPYRDFIRPAERPRNEAEVVSHCRALAERVATVIGAGRFPLVVGGDCSIVLGSLLGLRRLDRRPVGLAYIDGHADFATPLESRTGSVASMCLGLAVGRGDTPLARLGGDGPLIQPRDVALVGRRDEHEPWYGHDATVLDRIGRAELEGFWIHLDADVLDPAVMPAVDSPEPGGPGLTQLADLLVPLLRHPRALGMELTIYDPLLDPDEVCGRRLVGLLEVLLGGTDTAAGGTVRAAGWQTRAGT
jgi:arginase